MSGHEFEKQVRQKLNDLKMTPSTGSWENIENRLRERKRRPLAFYWIPLLLVGLAAGGYLFLNNGHNTNLSDTNSTHNVYVQPKEAGGSQDNTLTPQQNTVTPQEKSSGQLENTVSAEEESVTHQKKLNASSNVLKNFQQNKLASTKEKPFVAREIFHVSKDISPEKNRNLPVTENRDDLSRGVLTDATQANETSLNEKTAFGKNLSLKVADYSVGTITPSPLNFIESPKKATAKKSNKWSYGLSAFVGISAVNEGHLLNFNNAVVEDVSLVPSFAPRPSFKPSSISPGIAYSGGIFAKRQLNRRFSISIGANYMQLNTRSKVGDRENGSQVVNAGSSGYQFVYNYFRVERDKPSDYHNRYHFIELPIELHTRLNKSDKIPIQLTTGVAVSQLLKSSSLHFDGTTGVYYKDDRLLNQTQFAAKTGVSIGILNKTKRPLWIGPSAKYNVSKILKKEVSTRTNFMSLGVDVKMFIK